MAVAAATQFDEFLAEYDDPAEAYDMYVQHLIDYFDAYDIIENKKRKAIFYLHGGKEISLIKTPFVPTPEQTQTANLTLAGSIYLETFEDLHKKIKLSFPSKPTPYANEVKLSNMVQNEGETTRQWSVRLLKVARTCNFADENQMNRSVIRVIAQHSKIIPLQRDILGNKLITIKAIVDAGSVYESTQIQLNLFNKNQLDKIQIVTNNNQRSSFNNNLYNNRPYNNAQLYNSNQQHSCLDCGNKHSVNYRCPAEKIQCHSCHNVGHFARFCQMKQHQPYRRHSATDQHVSYQPQVNRPRFQSSSDYNSSRPGYLNASNHRTQTSVPHKIQQLNDQQLEFTHENSNISREGVEFENESMAELNEYAAQCYMANDTINQIKSNLKTNWTNIELNGEPFECILDTGANVSCINLSTFYKLKQQPKLTIYEGNAYTHNLSPIAVIGYYHANFTAMKYNTLNHTARVLVLVVPTGDNVLDNTTSQALGLVIIVNQIKEHPNASNKHVLNHPKVFDGSVGKYNVRELSLHINYDIIPKIVKHYRTPIMQRPTVSAELKDLTDRGLIEKVPPGQATTWVSRYQMVPKTGGGVRITIDGTGPNKALVREQHVMNTIDDIKIKIAGKKKITGLKTSLQSNGHTPRRSSYDYICNS